MVIQHFLNGLLEWLLKVQLLLNILDLVEMFVVDMNILNYKVINLIRFLLGIQREQDMVYMLMEE